MLEIGSSNLVRTNLITSWANLLLYSFELALIFLYMHRFPKDRPFIRAIVVSLLVADTISTISECAIVWLYVITHANMTINHMFWPTYVGTLAGVVSATVERVFLIYRIFTLSRSKIICGFLMILTLTHATACSISGIEMIIQPSFVNKVGATATTIGFCVSAVVDISIPIVLIFQLRKFSSVFQSSKNIIRRVTIHALSSGSVVAVTAVVFIIMFWTGVYYFLMLGGIVGRLYSITVLVNLVGREPKSAPVTMGALSNLNFHHTSPTRKEGESVAVDLEVPHLHTIATTGDSPRHFKNDV